MKKRPSAQPLGELETALMEIAWRHESTTAREACERMNGSRERAYTTVMTTLDRLHRKGLLTREKDGFAWRYQVTMSKAQFGRALADQLASKILEHGDLALSAFVDAAEKADEILLDKLERLIDERRRARR